MIMLGADRRAREKNEMEDQPEYDEFATGLIKSKLNDFIRQIRSGKLDARLVQYNLDSALPEKIKTYPITKIPNARVDLRKNAYLDLAYISLYSLIELYRQRGNVLFDKNVRLSGHAARADFLYTLAGNSEFGYSRDGLPGLRSSFALPTAVTVDGHGNILVADSSNNRIRVLAMSNGAFYGLSMKQGDVYTVAGSGSIGSFGSSIPTKADLTQPSGVASASSGAAWISNTEANEVCVLEPDSRTPSST